MTSMKGRELPKIFAEDDVRALLSIPNMKRPTGIRNRVMLELMYRAGLRVGELCKLNVRDVQVRERRVHIRAAIAKFKVERYVPLEEDTLELVDLWKREREKFADGSKLLFVTLKGGAVSPHYCWQMMQRYGRRAKIEGPCHPHMLRHTFATELMNEGDVGIREIQTLLGHKSVDTTMIYTHVSEPKLAEKIRRRRRSF
jgi:integrase/recombinase XerD